MNDGPIFSILTGKILDENPCGSCSGYCMTMSGTQANTAESSLAACADDAQYPHYYGYTTGVCLGTWQESDGTYPYAVCYT